MWRWLVNRIIWIAFEIVLLALVLHCIFWFLPGDAASLMLGTEAREDTLQATQLQLGITAQPNFFQSFLTWFKQWLIGNWGSSFTYAVPVSDLIIERLAISLPLVLLSFSCTLFFGIWGAFILFRLQKSWIKNSVNELAQLSFAIPNFWLGMILIYVFAVTLKWFPSGGFTPWSESITGALYALVLPVVALSLPQAILTTRTLAKSLDDIAKRHFVRTALAKGCTPSHVFYKHMLPMAMVAMLTLIGFQVIYFLAGTAIIEQVFHLPGIGKLLIQAAAQRDLEVLRTTILLIMMLIIGIFGIIDVMIHWLNPRMRHPVPTMKSLAWY